MPAHIETPLSVDLNEVRQPASHQFNDAHPLESRLRDWREKEEAFKMELLQRSQGAGEPIRRQMELEITKHSTFVPEIMGGPSNLHLDILRNTDAGIEWEDVHRDEMKYDFHQELQKRMGL